MMDRQEKMVEIPEIDERRLLKGQIVSLCVLLGGMGSLLLLFLLRH